MNKKDKLTLSIILFIIIILCAGADAVLIFGRSKGDDSYVEIEKKEYGSGTDNKAEFVSITDDDIYTEPGETSDYGDDGIDVSDSTDDDYIFPDSDTAYLEEDEVKELSKKELRLARNELYARHGYIFGDEELKEYFSGKDWYSPAIDGDDFKDSEYFNKYEIANRNLIKKIEAKK